MSIEQIGTHKTEDQVPKELIALVDTLSQQLDGKELTLCLSAILTIAGNTIRDEEQNTTRDLLFGSVIGWVSELAEELGYSDTISPKHTH